MLEDGLTVGGKPISAYEKGKHYPAAITLIKLSKILDTSIDYIPGLSAVRLNIKATDLTDREIKHLAIYRKLNSSQKDRLDGYAEGLSENLK